MNRFNNIAVIGAGISGLTIARLIDKESSVTIFETSNRPGGLIKCDKINGCLFHTCGGHVWNTKNEEVSNFFWKHFNRETEFIKSDRNSTIFMPDGSIVPYPIENHLFKLGENSLKQIISELIAISNAQDDALEYADFEDFLIKRFGRTLYELYFRPYNEKIWRTDLYKIPISWLEGKLPMPTPEEIFYNNILKIEEKSFVHSTFWYEKENGSQFIADRLSENLNIIYDSHIEKMTYTSNKWMINGSLFDAVIYTGNIRELPMALNGVDIGLFNDEILSLESHGTTTVFCALDKNPYSWIYLPDSKYNAHRIICTGNFSESNNTSGKFTGTIEFTDYLSYDDIIHQLKLIPLHPEYITHKFNPTTYPIQNSGTRKMISALKQKLSESNLFLCGRFAEWEYFNMDKAMESAIRLSLMLNNRQWIS